MKNQKVVILIAAALGVALLLGLAAPGLANKPDLKLKETGGCYYKGNTYSDGAVVCMGGEKYECMCDTKNSCSWARTGHECK